ncbi:MAG: alpha/beta hydrolase [Flavisolibacter sp.]
MQKTKTSRLKSYLKWILWVLVVQFVLVNIMAAIYAYKFTHFYNGPAPVYTAKNIFVKTWKLFVGPSFYKDTEETAPSFDFENVALKNSENTPIDAWYSKTDSADKCVIILHGISVNKSFLLAEASRFRQWNYSIMMIDFRGHGRSGGNTSTFGSKETDELQKAFAYAKSKGNKKIILYGVSMGAIVSMKAVAEGKLNPDALIIDAPFGSLHKHLRSRAEVLGFPAEPFASLVTGWIGIERGFNAFGLRGSKYATEIKCPVLLEWGEYDRYVKRNELESIYNNLSSQNKKLVIYPDAGHESYLQRDPILWERTVSSFLTSLY